jgi:hypothetical protein
MFLLGPDVRCLSTMLQELRLKSSEVIYFFCLNLLKTENIQGVWRHFYNEGLRNLHVFTPIRHEGTGEVEA